MRNFYLTIILLLFLSCAAQNKKTLSEYFCDCVNKIPTDLNQPKLISEIQKCAKNGYKVYDQEIQKIMTDFNDQNPNSNLTSAQNHVQKILTEKLIKECPKYAKIT